ncbi:MAG: cytochrome c553 [Myxococcota bacterium]|jgi:cytochrome c553
MIRLLTTIGGALLVALILSGWGDSRWENVRVLPADLSQADLDASMVRMSLALGVGCAHCHDVDNYAADTRVPKTVARDMIRMTVALNRDRFSKHAAPRVTCATCHRSETKPPRLLPAVRPGEREEERPRRP